MKKNRRIQKERHLGLKWDKEREKGHIMYKVSYLPWISVLNVSFEIRSTFWQMWRHLNEALFGWCNAGGESSYPNLLEGIHSICWVIFAHFLIDSFTNGKSFGKCPNIIRLQPNFYYNSSLYHVTVYSGTSGKNVMTPSETESWFLMMIHCKCVCK